MRVELSRKKSVSQHRLLPSTDPGGGIRCRSRRTYEKPDHLLRHIGFPVAAGALPDHLTPEVVEAGVTTSAEEPTRSYGPIDRTLADVGWLPFPG